jgi:hypothetical protein
VLLEFFVFLSVSVLLELLLFLSDSMLMLLHCINF